MLDDFCDVIAACQVNTVVQAILYSTFARLTAKDPCPLEMYRTLYHYSARRYFRPIKLSPRFTHSVSGLEIDTLEALASLRDDVFIPPAVLTIKQQRSVPLASIDNLPLVLATSCTF